ncbi:MAG: P-II family nitrogen regulator [Ruminococcaceae bacterium]|jgi:nitrogen regulatory protein PII|nr:P-II family nitrogen regulator [Oscillospiraceae bacterium]
MSELYLLTSIADRRLLPKFIALYQEKGIAVNFISLGYGTVSGERAALFLDQSEKAVIFSVVTSEKWKEAKRALRQSIRIDVPGVGIAFLVPMSSIGGRRELALLTDGQNFVRGEESVMKGTDRELLIVISNQGYNEAVMDAAREAGAYGGTVVHARGTGMERAEKFLGISLASEKDMVFIVVKSEQRDRIMQSIMLKAGMSTPAKAIVFSLPVTDTAGLRLLDDEEDEKVREPAKPTEESEPKES